MHIDDIDSQREFWIATVEDAVLRGRRTMSIPASVMTDKAAFELAGRFNLSVSAQGTKYVFVARRESTKPVG